MNLSTNSFLTCFTSGILSGFVNVLFFVYIVTIFEIVQPFFPLSFIWSSSTCINIFFAFIFSSSLRSSIFTFHSFLRTFLITVVLLISISGITNFPDLLYDCSLAFWINSAFTFLSILSPFSNPKTLSVKHTFSPVLLSL